LVDAGALVLNSLTANRRLAFRMVAVQGLVATVVALAFLLQDVQAALAAGIGGGAVALGSLVLAWRSMMGPAYSAGLALARMVSGLILKWFVVLGALYLSLARLGLPPLPLLAGLVATLAASFLTQAIKE
jgi:F0F1-type ATP synthase assembly protein I